MWDPSFALSQVLGRDLVESRTLSIWDTDIPVAAWYSRILNTVVLFEDTKLMLACYRNKIK